MNKNFFESSLDLVIASFENCSNQDPNKVSVLISLHFCTPKNKTKVGYYNSNLNICLKLDTNII